MMDISFVDYYLNEYSDFYSAITNSIMFRSCCDSISSIDPDAYSIGDVFLETPTSNLYVVCEDLLGKKQLTRLTVINE